MRRIFGQKSGDKATSFRVKNDSLRLEGFEVNSGVKYCDFSECTQQGTYRAPKSPNRLNEYFWFCLDHVREYNKSWNYYAGFNDAEVENSIRQSTIWDRPSWPFGTRRETKHGFRGAKFSDPFGLFEDATEWKFKGQKSAERSKNYAIPSAEANAFKIMGIQPPVTVGELKSRYKHLVKLNHPDRHGGDKEAEERLKLINEAYTTLKSFLS